MRDSKALRTARDNESDPYKRRFTVAQWNRTVTVTDVHALFNRLPEFSGFTRETHASVSERYMSIAHNLDTVYGEVLTLAITVHGDRTSGAISGIYSEHFPESTKVLLRTLAHSASEYSGRSLAHWQASGKHLRTWRTLNEQRNQS